MRENMMRRLVVDIETTAIPDDPRKLPDRIWCVVVRDVDTDEEWIWKDGDTRGALNDLMARLELADLVIGHNVARFDVPVLEGLADLELGCPLYDTLCASQLIFASNHVELNAAFRNKAGRDEAAREARFPMRLLRSHSLEAWGYRLGMHKAHARVGLEFWSRFSPEMLERCRQDVVLNAALFRRLTEEPPVKGWEITPVGAICDESAFARYLGRQERNGVGFDRAGAERLEVELEARRAALAQELQVVFPPWYAPASGQKDAVPEVPVASGDAGYTVPKRDRTMKPTAERPWPSSYAEGAPYTKVELVTFNPASTHHRAHVLQRAHGWRPTDFTPTGEPETSEEVLSRLDYPEVPLLLEYMTVSKRLGQLSEGKQSWLGAVTAEGRIHGRVNPTGTRTSRCSHVRPNLAQVPKVGAPWGAECRALFRPTQPGWVMVGADASGLELRMLAHRLAYYDGGRFAEALLEGDVHEDWRRLTGLFSRDGQKTFTYAFLYGAGDEKLGLILLEDWRKAFAAGTVGDRPPRLAAAIDLGRGARGALLRRVPGLELLVRAIRAKKKQGWFRGLDGRVLAIKTEHGALNDLLQSDGAIVMKAATVLFAERIAAKWYGTQEVVLPLLHVHDEIQVEADPAYADLVGIEMVAAIRSAGEILGVRCRLDGEYKVGANWKETH